MGQHRVQRQLLQNFSFEGRQPNSRETWSLNSRGHRPVSRSIRRVGLFEVDCSEDVDRYITRLENGFKDSLRRFSNGEFTRTEVGRGVYEFIAMHYVRSQACRLQIEYVVDKHLQDAGLTHHQAEMELCRLTSHQDVRVFQDLVDGVSRSLTHYMLCPLAMTGPWSFVTSDKIMSAGTFESDQRETFVWFPLSPSTGLCLMSDGHAGQLLGPVVQVNRRSGRIGFAKVTEAQWLRCQAPSPQEGQCRVRQHIGQDDDTRFHRVIRSQPRRDGFGSASCRAAHWISVSTSWQCLKNIVLRLGTDDRQQDRTPADAVALLGLGRKRCLYPLSVWPTSSRSAATMAEWCATRCRSPTKSGSPTS